jgi:glucose dehydrogenase
MTATTFKRLTALTVSALATVAVLVFGGWCAVSQGGAWGFVVAGVTLLGCTLPAIFTAMAYDALTAPAELDEEPAHP